MRWTVSTTLASMVFALALAGCASPDAVTGERLQGTAWIAESIDGKPVHSEARSTLRFFDRQLAGGSLGCNAYSTTYFTESGLRFGAIAATRKACAPDAMEQEDRFSVALEGTRRVRREEQALILVDAEGRARVRLAPLAP